MTNKHQAPLTFDDEMLIVCKHHLLAVMAYMDLQCAARIDEFIAVLNDVETGGYIADQRAIECFIAAMKAYLHQAEEQEISK